MATIIEKLSLSLKDFKNCLKHKHNETGVEELILRLRIQDDKSSKKDRTLSVWLPKQI